MTVTLVVCHMAMAQQVPHYLHVTWSLCTNTMTVFSPHTYVNDITTSLLTLTLLTIPFLTVGGTNLPHRHSRSTHAAHPRLQRTPAYRLLENGRSEHRRGLLLLGQYENTCPLKHVINSFHYKVRNITLFLIYIHLAASSACEILRTLCCVSKFHQYTYTCDIVITGNTALQRHNNVPMQEYANTQNVALQDLWLHACVLHGQAIFSKAKISRLYVKRTGVSVNGMSGLLDRLIASTRLFRGSLASQTVPLNRPRRKREGTVQRQ